MSRGGRTGVRTFVRPGIRAHAMKFNVGTQERRRLRIAMLTLAELAESVRLALHETGDVEDSADVRMRAALELLCFGPHGEFR